MLDHTLGTAATVRAASRGPRAATDKTTRITPGTTLGTARRTVTALRHDHDAVPVPVLPGCMDRHRVPAVHGALPAPTLDGER